MQTYRSKAGENLSLIIFEYYGKINTPLLNDVLDANQNIADISTVFPVDTVIHLPEIDDETDIPIATLWD